MPPNPLVTAEIGNGACEHLPMASVQVYKHYRSMRNSIHSPIYISFTFQRKLQKQAQDVTFPVQRECQSRTHPTITP